MAVFPHRDLRDAVVARFARGLRLHLHLLQLAGLEHAVELSLQEVPGLPVEHVEDHATHGVLARHPLRARLALAVPRTDLVVAVDHVQTDGEGVDDLRGEAPLRFHLVCTERNLGREIL